MSPSPHARLKKTFLLLFTLLITSGCSFKHFQETVLLPKINYKEAEEEIQTYLYKKYDKEFTITESERGCTGLGSDCAEQVYAYVYPNETPEINFRVTYDTKTKKIHDHYLQAFWENQIENEFQDFFEKNFEGITSFVSIRSNDNELNFESFPYYRDLLGKKIKNIKFVVTIHKWKENQENWRKEAKKLIKFKQVLMNEGFSENQLEAVEVAVWVKALDNRDADSVFLYKINMNDVSEEEATIKVIKE